MKKNEEIWLDEVLNSTKGMQRAKPSDQLFDKILSGINAKQAKIIKLPQLRIAVAAAALIALVNIIAISQYNKTEVVSTTKQNANSLVSNYNLYQ